MYVLNELNAHSKAPWTQTKYTSIEIQANRSNYNILKTIIELRGRRRAILDNSNFATASIVVGRVYGKGSRSE